MKIRAHKKQRAFKRMALFGSSIKETLYLLSNPANAQHLARSIAQHLARSIAQDRAGNKQERKLLDTE